MWINLQWQRRVFVDAEPISQIPTSQALSLELFACSLRQKQKSQNFSIFERASAAFIMQFGVMTRTDFKKRSNQLEKRSRFVNRVVNSMLEGNLQKLVLWANCFGLRRCRKSRTPCCPMFDRPADGSGESSYFVFAMQAALLGNRWTSSLKSTTLCPIWAP